MYTYMQTLYNTTPTHTGILPGNMSENDDQPIDCSPVSFKVSNALIISTIVAGAGMLIDPVSSGCKQ